MPDSSFQITDPATTGRGKAAQLASLRSDLPPERRALAEDLRALFGALGVSARRYAARRHLDASSVTRYLNGERVPPWDFVAGLAGDVREASAPLTAAAEKALRDTHRAALKTHRRSSEMQVLQDQLANADEETRRIKTRERALEEALFDREKSLSESMNRCQHLEMRLDDQRSAHKADLALWQGEYEQLRGECGDLRQEVLFLQEALAVTRAELIAAEGECQRLEAELDAMAQLESPGEGASSLMAALEAADRTTSVAELVAVVSDLEARTQKAMARELVSSASRSRRVEDVAALLSGLQQAGLQAHAEAALPALVMTRPATETAALAAELHHAGLDDCVATLLRSSIELHTPCDIVGLALILHRSQLTELTHSLLSAAFVVRTVTDVVAMTVWAAGTEGEPATLAALGPAAARRSPQEVVELSIALRSAGRDKHAESLQIAAAEQRSSKDIVHLIECFASKGMTLDADYVFAATQDRETRHVRGLVRALVQARHSDPAATVVDHAVRHWSVDDIASMIADFYSTEHFPQAAQALMGTLHHRPDAVTALFQALDRVPPGSEAVVEMAAASGSPEEAAYLLTCLESAELPSLAEVVFHSTLTQRPTGHAGLFLQVLGRYGAAAGQETALHDRARKAYGPDMARLLLALAATAMSRAISSVVRGAIADREPTEVVLLIKQLHAVDHPLSPRADDVLEHINDSVVDTWPVAKQAALVIALLEADLAGDAELLTKRASAQPRFKGTLKHEQTKHTQRVLSLRFWRKGSHSTAEGNASQTAP
ncbi:hypothetical protein ACPCSC_29465 [Streptomyces lavendulocolor]|uniref:hypothetical protein n=1 Tax=Streptomyces lavendulocolor TaxID=67316 RepID=UPI003C2C29BE